MLGSLSFAPRANPSLLPEQAAPPSYDPMTNAHSALKERTELLLLED